MNTMLTAKGQVTIPKTVRDALDLAPGTRVEFALNRQGEVVLKKLGGKPSQRRDRFDAARGKAQIKWRSDELMALLRD